MSLGDAPKEFIHTGAEIGAVLLLFALVTLLARLRLPEA